MDLVRLKTYPLMANQYSRICKKRLDFLATHSKMEKETFLNKFGYSYLFNHSDIDEYIKQIANKIIDRD